MGKWEWTVGAGVIFAAGLMMGTWQPGFDEWWHIYLGEVRPLSFSWEEIRQDSHPPLLYVLMWGTTGWPVGAIRALSVAGMALAAIGLHRILMALRIPTVTRHGAVWCIALSPAWISMALSIRGYGLMMCAFVWGWAAVLERMDRHGERHPANGLWLLAGGVAPWFTASALFPFAASVLALLVTIGLRKRRDVARLLPSKRVALVMVVHMGLYCCWLLWSVRAPISLWLSDFLRARRQPQLDYIYQQLAATWELFLPSPAVTINLALLITLIVALLVLAARALRSSDITVASAALVLPICLLLLVTAALNHRYPLGGHTRHQIFLQPLLLVGLAQVFTFLFQRRFRLIPAAVFFALIAWNVSQFGPPPGKDEFVSTLLWEEDRGDVLQRIAQGDTILCDSYTHIGLFAWARAAGYTWRHCASSEDRPARWDVYETSNPHAATSVHRLSTIWKWGRLDAHSTARRIDTILKEHPGSTVHLYVRDAEPNDGGGAGDTITRDHFRRVLSELAIRDVALPDLRSGWLGSFRR